MTTLFNWSVTQNLDPPKISSARNKFSCKSGPPWENLDPLTHVQKARSKLTLFWYGRCLYWRDSCLERSVTASFNREMASKTTMITIFWKTRKKTHLGLCHQLRIKQDLPLWIGEGQERAVRKHAATLVIEDGECLSSRRTGKSRWLGAEKISCLLSRLAILSQHLVILIWYEEDMEKINWEVLLERDGCWYGWFCKCILIVYNLSSGTHGTPPRSATVYSHSSAIIDLTTWIQNNLYMLSVSAKNRILSPTAWLSSGSHSRQQPTHGGTATALFRPDLLIFNWKRAMYSDLAQWCRPLARCKQRWFVWDKPGSDLRQHVQATYNCYATANSSNHENQCTTHHSGICWSTAYLKMSKLSNTGRTHPGLLFMQNAWCRSDDQVFRMWGMISHAIMCKNRPGCT